MADTRDSGKGTAVRGRKRSKTGSAKSRRGAAEQTPARDTAASPAEQRAHGEQHARTPIVGIGASAGGLEALRALFQHMPEDTGLAFVVIQHLDPHHESMMVELLARCTTMEVEQAREGTRVGPNRIYMIPPNSSLTVKDGVLHIANPVSRRGVRMPIDQFFSSLANDQKERAICIILSGTASEGAQGLREIKAQGGMAMVQDPGSAQYDGMPRAAVATGLVDRVLTVEEMPEALLRYVDHPYFREGPEAGEAPPARDDLIGILSLLRARTGHDFRGYKRSTLLRRVHRRMGLHQVEGMAAYLDLLRSDPAEVQALFRDLLVKVTSFFREPEAWQSLTELAIRGIVAAAVEHGRSLRAWVPACATGMEAYSLAILLAEESDRQHARCGVQIFATDIDQEALDQARSGVYSADIAADLSPERLERFFARQGESYRVTQRLREMVMFAPQNLLGDPPFSRLDLVSCRNLLIYIDVEMQRKLLPLFHFALRDGGFLFLGSSENINRSDEAFETVSKKWRIYRKVAMTGAEAPAMPPLLTRTPLAPIAAAATRKEPGMGDLANRVLAEHFAPAALIVDRRYEVVYFHGDTEPYLHHPAGEPTRELVALLREGLRGHVRGAVAHALSKGEPATVHAFLRTADTKRPLVVTALPLAERGAQGLVLLTFEPVEEKAEAEQLEHSLVEEEMVRQLELELKSTREELQSTIEELETSNEELKASNEEIMSINEELQSSNEELETSREELRSVNEELSTVNAQLQEKVRELESINDDLTNLLASTAVATVFLDRELRIRRFTPVASELLNMIPGDVGRALSDIASELNDPSLPRDARNVLDKLTPVEREVGTADGRWFLRRLLPFRTRDNRIEGVVLTLTDMTEIKHVALERAQLAAIVDTSSDAIISKGLDGTVRTWNRGAEALYGYSRDEMVGMPIETIIPPEERTRSARAIAQVAKNEVVRTEEQRRRKDGVLVDVELALAPVCDTQGRVVGVSTIARDVTAVRRAARELAASEARFRAAGELVPFGSWLCDPAGRCTFVTRPFIEATGRTLEELKGFGWLDLVPEEERAPLMDVWMRCVESGEDWNYEYRFRGADGTMKTSATKGRAVRDEAGSILFWAGFHLDVTDRRKLEDELRTLNHELESRVAARTAEAEERTSQLRALAVELSQSEQRERAHLAQVLHDGLQQLITVAKLHLKLATDHVEADDARSELQEVRDLLDEALHASQKLILELAPPQVQGAGLPVVLGWLADRVGSRFGLEIDLKTDEDLPETSLEQRELILRVVRELLLNAAKHAGSSRVDVRTEADGGFLVVEVGDHGKGFDPARAMHTSSTGYGLVSVREQLRQVRGTLHIDSAPGRGTRAVVRLPLAAEAAAPPPATESAVEASIRPAPGASRVRVMVVDDDEALRQGLGTLLGLEGAIEVVALASGGEQAIALARRLRPDVVVMDVSMKGMNGIEATRHIKAELREVTVFGLSVHDDRRVREDMCSAGASSYFVKGRDHERLIEAILARRRSGRGTER